MISLSEGRDPMVSETALTLPETGVQGLPVGRETTAVGLMFRIHGHSGKYRGGEALGGKLAILGHDSGKEARKCKSSRGLHGETDIERKIWKLD